MWHFVVVLFLSSGTAVPTVSPPYPTWEACETARLEAEDTVVIPLRGGRLITACRVRVTA